MRPEQNGQHFADGIFKCISKIKSTYFDYNMVEVCSWGDNGHKIIMSAFVQVMVYHRTVTNDNTVYRRTWWRHQMETFSALLAICAENSPVPGEFPAQRPMTRSFEVFFDLRLNKRLSKHSWGWWFEALSCPLWRHCNEKCRRVGSLVQCAPDISWSIFS